MSITLVDRRKEGLIPFIEKRAGLKFERIGAPQPKDIVRVAGKWLFQLVSSVLIDHLMILLALCHASCIWWIVIIGGAMHLCQLWANRVLQQQALLRSCSLSANMS